MAEPDEVLVDAPAEEYDGPAVVSTSAAPDGVEVDVRLRGHFEPIDGRFHWYGRLAASAELARRHRSGAEVVVSTPRGTATAKLSDVDPWGRFRVSGTGRPPF
ncbi:MAG TPA: DUF4873 domain-containing protein [Marmoricola sp.]